MAILARTHDPLFAEALWSHGKFKANGQPGDPIRVDPGVGNGLPLEVARAVGQ